MDNEEQKEKTRLMYGMQPGKSFDYLYDGLIAATEGRVNDAETSFSKSVEENPSNWIAKIYLHIMRD
jgi:hypothetical protein